MLEERADGNYSRRLTLSFPRIMKPCHTAAVAILTAWIESSTGFSMEFGVTSLVAVRALICFIWDERLQ